MNNRSAFPWTVDNGETVKGEKGMTLRDYFAAKAMQGAIAHGLFNADKTSLDYSEYIANIAYVYADAMMKAREA